MAIHADVQLYAKVPLVALLALVHLWVALAAAQVNSTEITKCSDIVERILAGLVRQVESDGNAVHPQHPPHALWAGDRRRLSGSTVRSTYRTQPKEPAPPCAQETPPCAVSLPCTSNPFVAACVIGFIVAIIPFGQLIHA